MSINHQQRSTTSPSNGIYPFVELPLRLGFPSRQDFEIICDREGSDTAVAALREFQRITRMCRISGHLLPYRSRHTRQLAPGIHLNDPHFCGLLDHSCDPNVFIDMSELWIWALKDIKKGDRLNMDFAATEDKLQRQFACHCGCYNCRGWIVGYEEAPNAEGVKFFEHWRRLNLR